VTYDWDAAKSERNLAQRGFDFDFDFATQIFVATCVELDDTRRDYGERRVVALGLADAVPLTVVFKNRIVVDGAIVRPIISARLSHRKERRRHVEAIAQASSPSCDDEGADEGSR